MDTDRRFPGVSLRELREDDADEVAELFRIVFGDERPIDAEQVVSWVRNEELDAAWLRVLELDGRVVGYGDIQVTEGRGGAGHRSPDALGHALRVSGGKCPRLRCATSEGSPSRGTDRSSERR